ncbi:MAG: metal ABC transporter permease [Candidatus Marinimicrobia bacterium]|nr:metal ABC transporter permease [Candidatus Neomarinimicrobiota bacterium]
MEAIGTLLELFPHSIVAGVLIAAACAALGVFVILKRMVFIGAVLSEVAAAGLALAMVWHAPPLLGAASLTLAVSWGLSRPFETTRIPRDAILGTLFAAAAALSVLLAARAGLGLEEIKTLLYGDLILTRRADLLPITIGVLPAGLLLACGLRPIVHTFMDRESARIMNVRVNRWEIAFFLALALVISLASRVAGAMLVFAYLVMPSSAALLLSRRLGIVMLLAAGLAVGATLAGLYASLVWDLPTNQLIVAFLALTLPLAAIKRSLID